MENENFDEIVKETVDKLYEEEGFGAQDDQGTDDMGGDENQETGEDNPEEENFSAESLEDFLKKTESKVSVKKEGCMPSPIFGNRDSKNHNKYRIFIENPKGKISFIFWDSLKNTEEGKSVDTNEALACFANDVEAYENAPSFEEFKAEFGYDETEVDLAQKAFNGCRKQMEKAKKMFTDKQLDELKRLASEI